MKANRPWNLSAFCAAILVHGIPAHGAEPPALPLARNESFQQPRLIDRPPLFELSGNRSARLLVELDVSATGEVVKATLAEGGFGQKHYVDRVLRWLKGAKFEPARIDGVPVAAPGLIQTVPIYNMEPAASISAGLPGRVSKAVKLIKDGDYPGADTLVKQLLFEHVTSVLDYMELQRQLALAYADAGRVPEALQAARDALAARLWQFGSVVTLPRELGELHMRLAASQGLLAEALAQYNLLGDPARLAPADVARAGEWKSAVESSQPLVGRIRLTARGRWTHELSRQLFRIENLRGALASAHFDCRMPGSRNRPLDLAQGGQFATSDYLSASDCTLTVAGEPGTEFEIVELPGGDPGRARVPIAVPATR